MKTTYIDDHHISIADEDNLPETTLEYTCSVCGCKFIPDDPKQDTCYSCLCDFADWVVWEEDTSEED